MALPTNTVLTHGTQPPAPPQFHRIHATRINHVWVVDVYGSGGKMGHGQARDWLSGVNAAIEDLKEKKS